MTDGNIAYLALCIGAAVIFAGVLFAVARYTIS